MRQGRPVRRVVRKVDVVSVLRLSFVFWLAVAVVVLLAGIVVWTAAGLLGVFASLSKFMASLGIMHFRLHGFAVLQAAVELTVVFVAGATCFCGVLAMLYNAVSGVVGGLGLVVLETDLAGPRSPTVLSSLGTSVVTRGAVEPADPVPSGIAVS